jgi:hypothetical protein
MGFGDEIMAAGEALRAQLRDPPSLYELPRTGPRPVAILDRRGGARWHAVWEGNPRIARPEQVAAGLDVQHIVNGPGCRPYLLSESRERYVFNADFRAQPGEIYLNDAELAFAAGYAGGVVVEPFIKSTASPNKNWGWARWQALVRLGLRRRPDLEWWQLGHDGPGPGTRWLEGVRPIVTAQGPGGFRQACAVLAKAEAAVLPEGGLHHAAAALGVPAVVIFGGFIAPAITGYGGHINLAAPHAGLAPRQSCGLRLPCRGCAETMAAVTPEEVAANLEALLCSSAKASGCRTASGTWSGSCATSAGTRP